MREQVRDLLLAWDRPALAMYVNDKLKVRDEMDMEAARRVLRELLGRVASGNYEIRLPEMADLMLDAAWGEMTWLDAALEVADE
jgi:hypothetical protein